MASPKNGTAFIFDVTLVDASSRPDFKAAPTLATGDVKVSTDEGAFANLATLPTVTPAAGKNVKVSLSAGEMTGNRIVVVFSDQTSPKEWDDVIIAIQTDGVTIDDVKAETALIVADTNELQTDDVPGLISTLDAVVDTVKVDTAAILIDTAEIGAAGAGLTAITGKTDNLPIDPADQSLIIAATDAIIADTEDLQARLPAALTGAGNMKSDVLAVDGDTDAADRLQRVVQGNVNGTVGAASTTTSIVTSALDPAAAVTDQFKGRIVTFKNDTTTANLRGQSTDITGNTALGVLAVTALTDAPVSGDTFTIS